MTSLLAILALGCSTPEPVLSGIPAEPILQPDAGAVVQPTPRQASVYAKADDVDIDVRHLCGKRMDAIRTELFEQMGKQENVRLLGGNQGQEIQFTRGVVRVADGTIYMIGIALNEPMYRREALQSLGFPAFTGGVIRTSRDYRINNTWDFRRIRMLRAGRDNEKVTKVEAWRWLPRERQ